MSKYIPPKLVKCPRCGWVHVALTTVQIAQFAPTPEEQVNCRQCLRCGASSATFVPVQDGDGPPCGGDDSGLHLRAAEGLT